MNNFNLLLNFKRGSCAEKEKSVKFCIPVMDSLSKVNSEAVFVLGVLIAMLTETFGDHGVFKNYQGGFVTVKIACDSYVSTLYDGECFIPCTGREHLL